MCESKGVCINPKGADVIRTYYVAPILFYEHYISN